MKSRRAVQEKKPFFTYDTGKKNLARSNERW